MVNRKTIRKKNKRKTIRKKNKRKTIRKIRRRKIKGGAGGRNNQPPIQNSIGRRRADNTRRQIAHAAAGTGRQMARAAAVTRRRVEQLARGAREFGNNLTNILQNQPLGPPPPPLQQHQPPPGPPPLQQQQYSPTQTIADETIYILFVKSKLPELDHHVYLYVGTTNNLHYRQWQHFRGEGTKINKGKLVLAIKPFVKYNKSVLPDLETHITILLDKYIHHIYGVSGAVSGGEYRNRHVTALFSGYNGEGITYEQSIHIKNLTFLELLDGLPGDRTNGLLESDKSIIVRDVNMGNIIPQPMTEIMYNNDRHNPKIKQVYDFDLDGVDFSSLSNP